jgi:hypothetical protein
MLVAACLVLSARAEGAGLAAAEAVTMLDVPFLSQSEQLCGGAAAAMVLRYWGERDVLAEDFASLVEADDSGIRGDVLADAVRERAWIAHSFRGDEASARDHLARGRPLIALIEDRPSRYHYVVLLAWLDGRVILHDPARGPLRMVAEPAFSAAWAEAGSWTLLILPGPDAPGSSRQGRVVETLEAAAPASYAGDCDALVQEGVRLVRAGDQRSAEAALSAALARCPASGLAARELAGLRFVQSRWQEAARLAARAASRAPDDAHTWRLLASSRFVQNDPDGALRAWNRVGEPRIDLVRVEGLDRTHQAIVEGLLGLSPRAQLTTSAFQRARRRLAMLPAASATRVDYRPVPGGLAEIDAAIVERPRFVDRLSLVAVAAHAATERELLLDLAAPAGDGARWVASWRSGEARPRLGLSLLLPVAFGRSGLWQLDGLWERQSYAVGLGDEASIAREDRKRLALSYTDWMAAETRVALGVAFDRWSRSRDHLALFGSVDQRLAHDRVAATLRGAVWPAMGSAASFGTGGVGLAWRSTSRSPSADRLLVTARVGVDVASAEAPFAAWPGADVGHARDVLMRAHPLLGSGIVRGSIFGRALAHGGMELEASAFRKGPARLGVAVFGDMARAGHGPAQTAPRGTQIDVGFGLRLRMAGQARTLRIDVAQGLVDGRRAISAGWRLPWPS